MALTSSMMHIGVGRRGEIVGDLHLPDDPHGLVVFAHGSGSSRHSRATAWSPAFSTRRSSARC